MTKFWMISDRNVREGRLGSDLGSLTYWVSDSDQVDKLDQWKKISPGAFRTMLIDAANQFPDLPDLADHEDQQHVTLFVHGYNVSWEDAVMRYRSLRETMFQGRDGMGICVLFTWPSDGMVTNYLPDRADARAAAPDLADVLSLLFDWMLKKQADGVDDPSKACRAKTSLIAHSMGNYVLQNAMQLAWTRKNQPLLVSLINQLIMVAADVDNDVFDSGETVDGSDGDAIANLSYRVTALYSGRDPVLGLSAGLKHFGKRRLGRSGLADPAMVPDNVWQVDCSPLFKPSQSGIHSAYFEELMTIDLMRRILRGIDRTVLMQED
jgi:esterase/lipase superfamily enzyme